VSDKWVVIGALAVILIAIKCGGPVLLGGRPLPARAMAIVVLLAPAVLAGLVVVQTFSHERTLVLDARAAGLAAAVTALVLRAHMLVVVVVAAVATAGVRAVT
jgi:hypothetical protein